MTYGHDVEKHATHVVAVPFMCVPVDMAVVVEVWRMSRGVVSLVVIIVAKLVVRSDG